MTGVMMATTRAVMVPGVPVDSTELRRAVTVRGIREHLEAFQSFADQSHGTRANGTVGFERSVDYVAAKAQAAGYHVTVQRFKFRKKKRTVHSANVLADTPDGSTDHTVVV